MKNPLNRRLTRELKGELGKYLVILILLIATIGFVSGFLVADGSMLTAYNESFEKYNIEDGHFTVVKQMNKAQKKNVEALGVTLYDLFYVEETLVTNDSTLRIFPDRKDVDKVCLMKYAGEIGRNCHRQNVCGQQQSESRRCDCINRSQLESDWIGGIV